ncbi:2-hydroxyacid dehydrogenase [Vibrio sp. 1-Bac 57]|uniref:2-hydroxyacid dehydrogenase n=1 Tax=Psychromonas sp. SA13A TaxID=2686346 RepID=UPI00140A852E|nr:2-hydroxyacid dehydrogenase [Psychromonas sp. SA13A]
MKPNILVLRALEAKQMAILEQNFTLHFFNITAPVKQLPEQVAASIIAIVTSGTIALTNELIDRLPDLKIISSSGVGYDAIDIELCNKRGIKVCNTPGLMTNDTADLAIMLILATRRRLMFGDQWLRSNQWAEKGPMPLTSSLSGKKLGIVGLGRIGQAIATRAQAMQLEIAYFGRNKKNNCDYQYESQLIDLANWADILVVCCPGGKDTVGLINKQILIALGKQGTLINVARGSVVDQTALIEALANNTIDSAGLDVFTEEPCRGDIFKGLHNVVLSPHHASGTVETRANMSQMVVDNLEAYFSGKALITPVN